jgi:hypothetical protein
MTIVGKLRLDGTCFQYVRFSAPDGFEVNMKPDGPLGTMRLEQRTHSANVYAMLRTLYAVLLVVGGGHRHEP